MTEEKKISPTAEEITAIQLKYYVPEIKSGQRLKALYGLPTEFLLESGLLNEDKGTAFRTWATGAFYDSEYIYEMLIEYDKRRQIRDSTETGSRTTLLLQQRRTR